MNCANDRERRLDPDFDFTVIASKVYARSESSSEVSTDTDYEGH